MARSNSPQGDARKRPPGAPYDGRGMGSIRKAIANSCARLRERGWCDFSCEGDGFCDKAVTEAEAEGEEVYSTSDDLRRCKYDDIRDGFDDWE